MRRLAAPLLAFLLGAGGAWAAQFTGYARVEGLLYRDSGRAATGEALLKGEEEAGPAFLAAALRLNASTDTPHRASLDPADRAPRLSALSLAELKLRLPLASGLDLEVGRFELGWGKTDGYSPADAFLPRDLTDPFADLKIPLWCARLTGQRGDLRGELVASPVSTPWRGPVPGSRFFPLPFPDEALEETGGNPPEGGFLAARLMAATGEWDLGLWARSGVLPAWTPEFVPDPATGKVRPVRLFTRENGVGVELSRLAAGGVARAELCALDASSSEVGDALVAALGYERSLAEGTLLLTWARSFSTAGGESPAPLDRALLPLLIAAWTIAPEWGSAKVVCSAGLDHGDGLAKGEVQYNFAGNWRALALVDIPYGPAEGPFGRLREARRLRLGLIYAW